MIDTHTHLNLTDYQNDLNKVIDNAIKSKVSRMIVVGIDYETSLLAINLSEKYHELLPSVGIHPGEADKINDLERIEDLIKENQVYAIGECGIDLYHTPDNLEIQKELFIRQIELSIKYDLPLIIHTRSSFEEVYQCLLSYKGRVKGVFHCFSGNADDAVKVIELGMHIGIGGVVTFKNADMIKGIVRNTDLKHILLETDCPYLAPVPFRGKRNEPAYLYLVAKEIAYLKNTSLENVSLVTTDNAIKLFNIGD